MARSSTGAWDTFRRGIKASPELKTGLAATLVMGVAAAIGRLSIPIALQRVIDTGFTSNADGSTSVDMARVVTLALLAGAAVLVSTSIAATAQRRLVRSAESAIKGLRTRAFDHVHRLSLADHVDTSSGTFLARVTSDVEAIARFVQHGLFAWTVGPPIIVGVLTVSAFYSWQLTIVVILTLAPTVPLLRWVQRRQFVAYAELRNAVANLLGQANELITGAATIRAYGVADRVDGRVRGAALRRYRAGLVRNRYNAAVYGVGDLFGSVSIAAVFAVGVWQRESLGLTSGALVAILFLVTILNTPIGELAESTDETQEAIAGWGKVLELLDMEVDVTEPDPGQHLARGPLSVDVEGVSFSYRTGGLVLDEVSLHIDAGANVAIVGQTGSGKTTLAKLMCRLADPTAGVIRLGGVALPQVASASRLASVRMVPQDGFLFATTLRENIRMGRPGASEADIAQAVAQLDMQDWVASLPAGLDTEVGSRGSNLSVGERQLAALIRAALADPGLLILDEATSAVDPATDQALTNAIGRLSQGRTVVSIAHRLATAEAADVVVVCDQGRIVEVGNHDELVNAGGVYGQLHAAWIGNTRNREEARDA